MKIRELEPIYKIYDAEDDNYEVWYGTGDDIFNYLEENKKANANHVEGGSWPVNLKNYGLEAELLNR
jgi:hypothetical protein